MPPSRMTRPQRAFSSAMNVAASAGVFAMVSAVTADMLILRPTAMWLRQTALKLKKKPAA